MVLSNYSGAHHLLSPVIKLGLRHTRKKERSPKQNCYITSLLAMIKAIFIPEWNFWARTDSRSGSDPEFKRKTYTKPALAFPLWSERIPNRNGEICQKKPILWVGHTSFVLPKKLQKNQIFVTVVINIWIVCGVGRDNPYAIHMSQRNISCSSIGLLHTWQWASFGGGVSRVAAGREEGGSTRSWARWDWDWIE